MKMLGANRIRTSFSTVLFNMSLRIVNSIEIFMVQYIKLRAVTCYQLIRIDTIHVT